MLIESHTGQSKMRSAGHRNKFMESKDVRDTTQTESPTPSTTVHGAVKEREIPTPEPC